MRVTENDESLELDLEDEGWLPEDDRVPAAETAPAELTPGSVLEWEVSDANAGKRIDRFVTDQVPFLSRSLVQKWIEEGHIQVNDQTLKPGNKLRGAEHVSLKVPAARTSELEPEDIPLDIVYEDEDVIVVNKPRGLVVHPAAGNYSGTLVNALLFHCNDLSKGGSPERPGIVHRIDKDTSGLLMVAKNDRAHRELSKQLSEHTVTRRYVAITHGVFSHDVGTVEAPIGRHPVHRQQMTVIKGGRHAVTHFTVLERFAQFTFVECRLETGRTHQIRVHFDFIGHPLAGDPVYGPKRTLPIGGQALHAETLGFIHPKSQKYLEFHAEMPADMQILLDRLRSGVY